MDVPWKPAPAGEVPAALGDQTSGLSPLLARLLALRGVETARAARDWLHPDLSSLADPLRLRGAREAAERLLWAARSGRRIVVFGDYDVDGVTAAAQLLAALRRAGADARAFIPHRLRDGYGFRPDTVRAVVRDLAPALLVTVDCGITAADGVAEARAAGVEVIVTDHHLVPEQLPPGAVVVNPKQPGCEYPEKDLAACGIAFRLAEAFGRLAGVPLARESLLRAACLGTIADMVPLRGENRLIASGGLSALAAARAPGLRALLAECGIAPGSPPSSEEVAFRLAPRLNAAGRVDTAEMALALFELRNAAEASGVARQLTLRNVERQCLERRVVASAREKILREGDPARESVLIAGDEAWHRGVLGIAASRLAREYHRPVMLFGLEGDRASGSGRSIPGVSIHTILGEVSAFFLDFGGHDQAVGGSLRAVDFPAFRDAARSVFAQRVAPEALAPMEEYEADLPLETVGEELMAELDLLEPHGVGNPRPVFHCGETGVVGPLTPLGESGTRGALPGRAGPIPFRAWGGLRVPPSGPMAVLYRLTRGRSGLPEAEILRVRA
ncbi:MAG: single-stranded-DNA-specific exonuclease RecJ [Thermoanaerobaculia bacterium]